MKVAILTQPLGHNYGGLLQAYALQTYLKKLGHEVETLDRRKSDRKLYVAKSYMLNVVRLMLGKIKSIPTNKKQIYVLSELAEFRDKCLTMSPEMLSDKALRGYYKENLFDAFIVGSDQVWRPRYSPCLTNFFLDFLDDIGSSAKRIAYAASFGTGEWEYTKELTEKCKSLAKKFDAVSVREGSAVGLSADKLGVKAELVVDPTLLLEPSDYEPLIQECTENAYSGCVLSYVLDPAPEKLAIAGRVGKLLGIKFFSIKPEQNISQVPARALAKCQFPSVETWLQAFHDAGFVVTDSFHGTVFSILFNKPFIAVGNTTRGMARFESLLSQFGLTERLVASIDDITPALIQDKINWREVNRKRVVLATSGREFLKTHLSGS